MSNNISFLLLDGIVLRGLRHLVLLPPIPFLLPLAGPRAHDPLSGQVIYGHPTRSHDNIPVSITPSSRSTVEESNHRHVTGQLESFVLNQCQAQWSCKTRIL